MPIRLRVSVRPDPDTFIEALEDVFFQRAADFLQGFEFDNLSILEAFGIDEDRANRWSHYGTPRTGVVEVYIPQTLGFLIVRFRGGTQTYRYNQGDRGFNIVIALTQISHDEGLTRYLNGLKVGKTVIINTSPRRRAPDADIPRQGRLGGRFRIGRLAFTRAGGSGSERRLTGRLTTPSRTRIRGGRRGRF